VTIRAIEPADHARWRALFAQYFRFYQTAPGEDVYATTWRRILDPAEPVWGAVAVKDGRIMGLVHYVFHPTTWAVDDTCYLQDLFVDPVQRGGGIGRQLIEHVAAEARRRNCIRVYWQTAETNSTAQALYDKLAERSGFVQYRLALNPEA
jgi:GNAT superfamily N-acetyltransferase